MEYEYTSENRIKKPHHYMYTPYYGRKFLDIYFDNRVEFKVYVAKGLDNMDAYSLADLLSECKDPDGSSENSDGITIALVSLIEKLYSEKYTAGDEAALGAFIHRFEVKKNLGDDLDLKRTAGRCNKDASRVKRYILLAIACSLYFEKSRNLKYLNCLLKLNDLIVSVKSEIRSSTTMALAMISIDSELQYTEQLYRQKVK